MKNLDVVSLVSEDQQFRSKRNVPKFEPQHVTAWSGDKPRLAVDEKGVPVVLCVPNWLRKQAHVSFSRRHLDAGMTEVLTLRTFCSTSCVNSGSRSAFKSKRTLQTRPRGIN